MAAIYVRWIQAGRITLDDVPERWRERGSGDDGG